MKFVISTQELNFMVSKCLNVISAKPPMPLLNNIMLEAKNGQLIATATDLATGIRCFTEAKILEEGATALPGRTFASLLRELTALNVEVATNENHLTVIHADSSKFKIHGMGCNEFPCLPDLSGAVKIRIPQEQLKDMFYRTAFCVSKEDNRYALTGVGLQIDNGVAVFTGTDGKRLSRAYCQVDVDPAFSGSYIVPVKAVEEMIKNLEEDGMATLYLMPDKIGMETDNSVFVTKLLSGEYPDVTRVIPTKTEAVIPIHREELSILLRQVVPFALEARHVVKFSFSAGELMLQANSTDVGEGKVSMAVNYRGGPLEIAFNPGYFLDILRHIKSETVHMGVVDAFNPGVITEGDAEAGSAPWPSPLFVLMPMRLTDPA